MSVLQGVLYVVLSWTNLCQILWVVVTGLVIVVAAWTARLLVRHAWYVHRLSCFSRPRAHSWLIGHLGQMQSTEEGLLQVDDLVQTYKHSCSWFLGPFYHLVRVFHPDYVKPLLMAPASITMKDELIYGHLRPWLGQSLLTTNGDEWLRRRRLLTPAFHFDILKNYVSTFNASANTMHVRHTLYGNVFASSIFFKRSTTLTNGWQDNNTKFVFFCFFFKLSTPTWDSKMAATIQTLLLVPLIALLTYFFHSKPVEHIELFNFDHRHVAALFVCENNATPGSSDVNVTQDKAVSCPPSLPPQGKWCRLVAEGRTNVEIFDHVTLMTLDSLLKCAFSYNSNCQESNSEYVSAIVKLSDLVIDRRFKMLHHWDWIYWKTQQGKQFKKALSVVHRFTSEVVQRRRALISQQRETDTEFTTSPQRKRDFVDLILLSKDEDGQGLTDEEIQAEANTFMFAGHDSTASAICWTLYNLARHAHHQDKCREEVMDLMQGRDREDIEWEDLSNLTFTTMCIRESLRLHSPVQAVTRKYSRDMMLPGDRTVPEGAICLVSIYGTHHNPTVWTDPHEYNPLRFDPATTTSRASHAFIPFSSGPRNCIGQKFALAELRVVVALTLLRFRLTLGLNPSGGGVRRLPQLVLRAEGGLWLQLEPLTAHDMEK